MFSCLCEGISCQVAHACGCVLFCSSQVSIAQIEPHLVIKLISQQVSPEWGSEVKGQRSASVRNHIALLPELQIVTDSYLVTLGFVHRRSPNQA